MKIRLERGLPFVRASLKQHGHAIELEQVLLDTGSEKSVFSADELLRLNIFAEKEDPLHRVRGVGGIEFVFSRRLEEVAIGEMELRDFEVQVGAMEYGFPIQGILGLDFLLQVSAVIDLGALEVRGT